MEQRRKVPGSVRDALNYLRRRGRVCGIGWSASSWSVFVIRAWGCATDLAQMAAGIRSPHEIRRAIESGGGNRSMRAAGNIPCDRHHVECARLGMLICLADIGTPASGGNIANASAAAMLYGWETTCPAMDTTQHLHILRTLNFLG